jgi:Predicted chitinase
MKLMEISKSRSRVPAAHVFMMENTINKYADLFGLSQPHRLAHFLAQVMHESMGLVYVKEIWGPTPAQKRYEGRADLGNTQPGDGSKFRGYGFGQITGRSNTTVFYNWCVRNGLNPPNFIDQPELMATDVWAGLSAIWFWSEGNRTGKSLNVLADRNDIEQITKIWNGGLNGYDDRLDYYVRTALVLLDMSPVAVRQFQTIAVKEGANIGKVDGDAGPKTRAALHKSLLRKTAKPERSNDVAAAPVVETKQVMPKALEQPWYFSKEFIVPTATGGGFTALTQFVALPWQNLAVVMIAAIVVWLLIQRSREKKALTASVDSD